MGCFAAHLRRLTTLRAHLINFYSSHFFIFFFIWVNIHIVFPRKYDSSGFSYYYFLKILSLCFPRDLYMYMLSQSYPPGPPPAASGYAEFPSFSSIRFIILNLSLNNCRGLHTLPCIIFQVPKYDQCNGDQDSKQCCTFGSCLRRQ